MWRYDCMRMRRREETQERRLEIEEDKHWNKWRGVSSRIPCKRAGEHAARHVRDGTSEEAEHNSRIIIPGDENVRILIQDSREVCGPLVTERRGSPQPDHSRPKTSTSPCLSPSSNSGSIRPKTSPDAMLTPERALPVDGKRGRTNGGGTPPKLVRRSVGDAFAESRRGANEIGSRVRRPIVDGPELGARAVLEPALLSLSRSRRRTLNPVRLA